MTALRCAASLVCAGSVAMGQQKDPGVPGVAIDPRVLRILAGGTSAVIPAFALSADRTVALDLSRFEVLTGDARVVMGTDAGDVQVPRPDVRLWRGRVIGEADSHVYLAVSPMGTSGYVRSGGTTYFISSGPLGALAPRIWDGANAAITAVCDGIVDVPGAPFPIPLPPGGADSWVCRSFTLAVDCDYEYTQNLFAGDATASAVYAVTLIGAASEIYQRDTNISIDLAYLRTWTTVNDPYSATTTSTELPEFQNYWVYNMSSVSRNLAHLLSGRSLGGGIAYGNAVCNGLYGYAVSSHLNGFFPYPLQDHNSQNWDVMVTTHEMGHILGSRHTHDPAQYNPPLDGCGNAYLSPPLPQDCSLAWTGTIMSYCHLCPPGMANINLTFGPRVEAAIRGFLDLSAPSCGTYPTLVFSQQPAPASVAAGDTAQFAVGVAGHAPVTYQWRHNGTALADDARIHGTTTASLQILQTTGSDTGNYDVVVANFCGSITSDAAALAVGSCYPNCDGSTTEPRLNVLDLGCFLNRFAAGDSYANCDGSTVEPVLNVLDFACFLNAFAGGCP